MPKAAQLLHVQRTHTPVTPCDYDCDNGSPICLCLGGRIHSNSLACAKHGRTLKCTKCTPVTLCQSRPSAYGATFARFRSDPVGAGRSLGWAPTTVHKPIPKPLSARCSSAGSVAMQVWPHLAFQYHSQLSMGLCAAATPARGGVDPGLGANYAAQRPPQGAQCLGASARPRLRHQNPLLARKLSCCFHHGSYHLMGHHGARAVLCRESQGCHKVLRTGR